MIEVTVPNRDQLERDLNVTRAKMLGDLKKEITRIAIEVTAHVKDQKLSGQALKVRSGRLRRSINYKVSESDTNIEATVGTNVEYARVHEFGFKGTVGVREYMRGKKEKFKVRAHSRRVNLPERSFLRSALDDKRRDIDSRIAAVVGQAIAGGMS